MADDIVTRLRDEAQRPAIREVCSEAADTIERLYAENERLHVAIYWLVADIDHAHLPDPMGRLCVTCGAGDGSWPCIHRRALDDLKEARREQ